MAGIPPKGGRPDGYGMMIQVLGITSEIKALRKEAHRELARSGLESALVNNELGATIKHLASELELDAMELQRVLQFANAGVSVVSLAVSVRGIPQTIKASKAQRLEDKAFKAGKLSPEQLEARLAREAAEKKGSIGPKDVWTDLNQNILSPTVQDQEQAAGFMKERAGEIEGTNAESRQFSSDQRAETSTEESLSSMLRNMARKGGKS